MASACFDFGMTPESLSCADPEYFKNYAGTGKTYDQVWNNHSYAEELVDLIKIFKYDIKSILVLGTATGKVLKLFEKTLHIKPWGCEINAWAYKKIPEDLRRRIRNMDMLDYIKLSSTQNRHYDLAFSNSFIYLTKKDLRQLMSSLAPRVNYMHFQSSLLGQACPDPYRKILESYEWWSEEFVKVGFSEVKIPRTRRSYLWKSSDFCGPKAK